MRHNFQLFIRSLSRHPGLPFAFFWAGAVALSLVSREPVGNLECRLIIWAIFAGLPWLAILPTAWAVRNQYRRSNLQH